MSEGREVVWPIVTHRRLLSVDGKIGFFFHPPDGPASGDVSTLLALRQELIECLFGLPLSEPEALTRRVADSRVFSGAILISTGIELLAKLWAGRDYDNEAGKRFREFVQNFMNNAGRKITEEETSALYAFRCSLVHSFALYDSKRRYEFHLDLSAEAAVSVKDVEARRVVTFAIRELYLEFLAMSAAYRVALQGDAELQANFVKMFDFYGSLVVLPSPTHEDV